MPKTDDSKMAAPAAQTTRGTPYKFVPLSYKESFRQWWSSPSAKEAESRVLSHLPFFPEPKGGRTASISQVDIGDGLHLNEFSVTNVGSSGSETAVNPDKNLVILHGYGAGLALFYKNFDAWSSVEGSRMYALDLLGFGRSSRPRFSIKTKDLSEKDDQGRFKAVVETESWFLDSLEKWRQARNLNRFTLVGHSMGGYLAAAYAMKYPERVDKLVLLSPAGVERGYTPEMEKNVRKNDDSETNPALPKVEEEFMESQNDTTKTHEELERSLTNELSTSTRNMSRTFKFLWHADVSPFSILKLSGFIGPRLISQWSYRRFSDLPESEMKAMHDYVYKIFTGKSSGEYAITRILASGIVARMPMIDRVARAGGLQCPSLWIYGENDWMNVHAGEESVRRLQLHRGKPQANASFHTVDRAGHHVYLDNPSVVDKLVLDFFTASD